MMTADELEDFLWEASYDLDYRIEEYDNPDEEYRAGMMPFCIGCMKKIDGMMNDAERRFLAEIEYVWSAAGTVETAALQHLQQELYDYRKSLMDSERQHRFIASALESLTSRFSEWGDESQTWFFISGLLQIPFPGEWLYDKFMERYNHYMCSDSADWSCANLRLRPAERRK